MKTITAGEERCKPAPCSLAQPDAAALRVDQESPTLPGPKMHRIPANLVNYMIHRRGMKKSKPRRKHMPNNLEPKVVFVLDLSEAEIQAIDGHPAVRWASKQILKALEAITGWRMRIPESIVPSSAVGGSLPLPGSPFSCLPCCQTFLLAASC